MVTPLSAKGKVSETSVARLISSVRPHVSALLPALSTGEGQWLSDSQWYAVVSATLRHACGLPVVAGILRPSTEEVLSLARAAAQLGVSAIAVGTPFGPTVDQSEMYCHYARLAAATALPVMVYHESATSGNTMDLSTLSRVCRLPGVVGVKDSSGDTALIRKLAALHPDMAVFQGLEHLLPETGPVNGFVLALANVEPQLCADLFADPSSVRLVTKLTRAVSRYGLDREDFVRALKTELHRRGVLDTAATAACAPDFGEDQ